MSLLTQTVRDIALEEPSSIRVFEEFGIDYCCGGRKPLSEACATRNIEVNHVIAALERAAEGQHRQGGDWKSQPLALLVRHIVDTHHAYVRREVPRLAQLAARVVSRHGDTRAELPVIQNKLADLSAELTQHCTKEEVVLFPYIAKLEAAILNNAERPHSCFGSVNDPIAMMMREHDAAGTLTAGIRDLSSGFTPPVGACPTFHAFYAGLHEFEQDLHQHVHLENNILFPRAAAMETSEA